ncbi:protein transport protein Sec31A-like isoform X2 [Clytia hemisphaerica]|uniref:protein transport protein Sec31A-like isoform X2 n=1 Tax=Clytia hemisphaerica TaxID=252671 RepID=UPI0034D5D47E
MKIKEIQRTANVAWSPKQQYPIYLAAGTAAQQLDASFSTSAALDIYHVNLESKEFDMPIVGSLPSQHRFHKLLWSDCGMDNDEHKNGLILGGTDNGELCVISAAAILNNKPEEAHVTTFSDHSGAVTALDINRFQSHIVASGGPDSEIFIWDLKNIGTPLTPGPKTTPPDQISCLAWNKQVQHILASSTQTGRVVVWDLRKSEPIIKVGDQSSMYHYKSIAWHPDVATQILIANEDDRSPVIQMWDLRFAASPMKVMEGHQRGILSLAWCPEDSDLLMSCGKDNKILCWDPNTHPQTGEIVYELPSTAQWTSDVCWCPRNPNVVSTTAFDGHITVSTLMGGSQEVQQQQQRSQISDSFGIQQDAFTPPITQQPQVLRIEPLKKPPKWMRKPCAARFGFGGKLVSFGNVKEPGQPKQVFVSQVVTDTELINRSHELESSLMSGQLEPYCDLKISNAQEKEEKLLWEFIKCNFSAEPRMQFLDLLGFNPQDLAKKISALNAPPESSMNKSEPSGVNPTELAEKIENLQVAGESDGGEKLFGSGAVSPMAGSKTPGSESEGSALFDQIAAGTSTIPDTTEDTDGLICQALLAGNFEAAVDVCFNDQRMADGLLLAIAGGPDLFLKTQKRYLALTKSSVSKIVSAVVNRDWKSIVDGALVQNWREALSMLVTYSKAEEFSELCCMLGERLENEANDFNAALICYVCAGDVERMVSCWTRSKTGKDASPLTLQSLIEKVMVLKKSTENNRSLVTDNTHLAEQLCNYAKMLSSQGNLQTAMMYLSTVNNESVSILKDRVFRAHGQLQGFAPECPFQRLDLRPPHDNRLPHQSKTNKYGASGRGAQQPSPNTVAPSYGQQQPNYFHPSPVHNPPNAFSPPNSFAPSQPTNTYDGHTNAPSTNYNQPMMEYGGVAPPPPKPSFERGQPQPTSLPQPGFTPQATPSQPNYNQPPPNMMQPTQPNNTPFYNPSVSQQPTTYQPAAPMQPQQPPMPAPMQPGGFNIMNPSTPPAHEVGPPPPSHQAPRSMRETQKDVSPNMPNPQAPPNMNFFNPTANLPQQPSVMQPGMMQQGMMQPGMMQPGMMQPGMMQPGMTPNNTMPAAPSQPPSNNMVPPGRLPPRQNAPVHKKEELPAKAEIAKGPIPEAHLAIQQTFDAIVERCQGASNNPQHKRKLEDVRRRLEILYDLLRTQKLSPNVINGLHGMVQACQGQDYMAGIQVHTQMISTGNFSEISSFMPGLKTMMQIAKQLRV